MTTTNYKVRFFDRYDNENFKTFMAKVNTLGSTAQFNMNVERNVIDFDNEIIEYIIYFELQLPEIYAEHFIQLLHDCNKFFMFASEAITY